MGRLETSGVLLRKDMGIYIIMYKKPKVYLQKVQGGWNLGNLIVSGGFMQKELDT
jgi:hypothetical protein